MLNIEMTFQHCVQEILQHEGGLSKDKSDPGGTTNWGISLRYLKSMGMDLNGDGVINDEDIVKLPVEGAIEIYRKYWWDKYHYANFNELVIVEKVFDLAVNMGGFGAHKLLQKSINNLSSIPIIVDGILGEKTFEAANVLDGEALRERLRQCSKYRYLEILKKYPAMECFRNGWLARAAW